MEPKIYSNLLKLTELCSFLLSLFTAALNFIDCFDSINWKQILEKKKQDLLLFLNTLLWFSDINRSNFGGPFILRVFWKIQSCF